MDGSKVMGQKVQFLAILGHFYPFWPPRVPICYQNKESGTLLIDEDDSFVDFVKQCVCDCVYATFSRVYESAYSRVHKRRPWTLITF